MATWEALLQSSSLLRSHRFCPLYLFNIPLPLILCWDIVVFSGRIWITFNLYVLIKYQLLQKILLILLINLLLKALDLFHSQKYMPGRKTGEEMNFTYVECLLYTFHHLAHKVSSFFFFVFSWWSKK